MSRVSTTLMLFLLFFLPICVGVIFLQVWLSKKENKWYGRILPIVLLLLSLIVPLNMAAPLDGTTFAFVLQMLIVWLLANIPTVILLLIYLVCREKQRQKMGLDKMNIQDLH